MTRRVLTVAERDPSPDTPGAQDLSARVNDILREALELPEEERDGFVERACDGDAGLEEKVRGMLRGIEEDDSSDWQPGLAQRGQLWGKLLADLAAAQSAHEGERIGPYTIIRQLARGGMGEVYLAEADGTSCGTPVALKVMYPGTDPDLARRFEQERQILASLDHPAIARHVDGGLTPDGRAWVAMEYVDGLPVDLYCDQHRLPVRQRLRLVIDIARAVQYAHRCMVVHRDLKPSNILVKQNGEVKLVDFGIAKLLDPVAQLAAEPLTRTGLRVMTPEYASPEQVLGKLVTAASDVYQLGVLLYELLSGRRPYRLSGCTSAEIERTICERQPPAPSVAVGTAEPGGPAPDDIAAARDTRPERLAGQLRGDLDTIVLMALRKEPERRYQSVEQLIRDIERHLAGHPVSARRDTAAYRLVKFIRRHPIGLAASAVILLLVTSFAGFLVQQRHARVQRDVARAEQVAAFLQGLFDVAEPVPGVGDTITAKDLLDRGAERLRTDLSLQPRLQATLMGLLGDMYRKLGAYDQAQELLEQALAARRQELGESHPEVAQSLNELGLLYTEVGRYGEAEQLFQDALARQRSDLGDGSIEVAHTRVNLANLFLSLGRHEEAEELLRSALAVLESRLGGSHEEVATVLTDLSALYWSQGRYDEAEPLLRRAITVLEQSPGHDRELAIALGDLGQLHAMRGRFEEAEQLLRQGYAVLEQKLGPDHPETAMSMKAIANLLVDQGRYDEAEEMLGEVLATLRSTYRGDHPQLGEALNDIALLHWSRGEYGEAERLLRESLRITERTLGPDHPDVAAVLNSLGALHWRQGELLEAEAAYRRSLQVLERTLGEDHPHTAVVLGNLASVCGALGEHDQATALAERAVAVSAQAFGSDHPNVAATRCTLASLSAECGELGRAEQLLEKALQVQEESLGPEHIDVARTLKLLCSVRVNRGDSDSALPLCQRALDIETAVLGPEHPDVADSLMRLGLVNLRRGRYGEADEQLQQALGTVEHSLGPESPDLVPILNQAAEVAARQGHKEQAEQLYQRALETVLHSRETAQLRQRFDLAETYLGLGDLSNAAQNSRQAKRLWQQALQITESGIAGVCAVRSRRTHCLVLLRLGRFEEARPLVESLLASEYRVPDVQQAWSEARAKYPWAQIP